MPETLNIAIDLTPLLPGGENGGARLLVFELLYQLIELVPDTRFILLTQSASHAELAWLDRPNVQRMQVVGAAVGQGIRPRLARLASWLLKPLPIWAQRASGRLAYGVNATLKRLGSRSQLKALGVDLLYCPFTAPTFHEPGLPTVCTLYDLQERIFPGFFSPEDLANRAGVLAALRRQADLVITISEHTRAEAIAAGLDPARIQVIPPRLAQRLARYPLAGTEHVLDRLGIREGYYLLYPANFWPHKNHSRLFAAFKQARVRGLPDELVLVCTGAPGKGLEQARASAAALGLAPRVRFPGYLTDPQLAVLLNHAAGLIFPSLYEGFGLPVIEAMAAGIPVACSHTAALPEVAGDAAILFDPLDPQAIASAMFELVLNQDRRALLVAAGQRRAAQFSDSRAMAEAYWSCLYHLLRL
ncbi:glycosyltransferase family 4 protein [Caldichromatium japonicum]|uniref:Glycosyltransferase family 4 protein n=1 Tax=Caldichromatium japonicum TaxID=2699430 RepID=A0A6G7VAH1_9GAMM|nr:glycosyltransferase family 1 protein [Caldichromatium japonicum]QIK36787.1 glycosyltransferase family 4 protein [Caldichromatium japonicum]